MSGFSPSLGKIVFLLGAVTAVIGAAGVALKSDHAPLAKIEPASPAQMQRLQDDHAALNQFLEKKQNEVEAKEAERVRALDAARDQAANDARMKAEAAARAEAEADKAAAREAAIKAAAQRKAMETAAIKPVAVPAPQPAPTALPLPQPPAAPTTVAGEIAPVPPMPITPQVVQPRRGPIDRAIATANAVTDKTLAAADAVRSFFTNAAGKMIGISVPPSRITSHY